MSNTISFGLSSFRGEQAGVSPARFGCFQVYLHPMRLLRRHLSCQRLQTREPEQVVRRADQVGVQLHAANAPHQGTAQAAVGFHPAEDLFNALALALAHGVATMPRGAAIQSWGLATIDHREVRCDFAPAQMRHEILAVIALVGAQRADPYPLAPLPLQHGFGGLRLGLNSRGDLEVDAQAVAILHQRMTAIAELGFLALAFAHELGVGVSRRGMGGVGTPLTTDVDHALIVWAAAIRRAVLAAHALRRRGPGFDERTVDGEM